MQPTCPKEIFDPHHLCNLRNPRSPRTHRTLSIKQTPPEMDSSVYISFRYLENALLKQDNLMTKLVRLEYI